MVTTRFFKDFFGSLDALFYQNIIEIIRAGFEKVVILRFGLMATTPKFEILKTKQNRKDMAKIYPCSKFH